MATSTVSHRSDVIDDGDDCDENPVTVLSFQAGVQVLNCDNQAVFKRGSRVHRGEEAALRLVKQHNSAPVPGVVMSSYQDEGGSILMEFVPGQTLTSAWDSFNDQTKEKICRDTWEMITRWREIPRPTHIGNNVYQCLADGSATTSDTLLKNLDNTRPTPIESDNTLRDRIYRRYLENCGRRYEHDLPSMLPRSSRSVFTHADVAPQNIMVDESGKITGIIDWERAGWYPDYWEYANIMKPRREENWQEWMDRTAPQRWDLSGIKAARRVLL